jgi:tight adherence protein C
VRAAVAAVAAIGVFLVVAAGPAVRLAARVEAYLRPVRHGRPGPGEGEPEHHHRVTVSPTRFRRLAATLGGGVLGSLMAHGDLFVSGPSRSGPALALLGAAAGALLFTMHESTLTERRARRLRHELPVVAEAIALHVMAGESVSTAIGRFVEEADGVAADELAAVVSETGHGLGLPEAMHRAARRTIEPEAARLYAALGYAHVSGGRLGPVLSELAVDYRAALSRDLTAEGGRRSLAIYGPVLGLMVPVTLLFLLFPTIDGLRSLAP